MTIFQDNLKEYFPNYASNIDSFSSFFEQYWPQINNVASLMEILAVGGIFLISLFLQKLIENRFSEEESHKYSYWAQNLIYIALSFSAPFIAFALISLSMTVSAGVTEHLEIYKLAIKFTLVWFIWMFALRMIPDLFVRMVLFATVIPFFVLSSLGFSAPVIHYLDSLGFPIGDVNVSIYLILKGLLIGTCLFWLARFLSQTLNLFLDSQKKITAEVRDLLENISQVIIYTSVVLMTLNLLGIELKSLAIVGGAIGIGIGLGLQKIAANFISGFIILFEQNVKVGHLVEVGGSKPGWIRHLGARAAVIDTGDGREMVVPNEDLLTKSVVDWTSRDRRLRTDLTIKVAFRSNLENAKQIILDAVINHPNCSKTIAPACYLEKFTDNGAQFLLQFWVDDLTVGKMDIQNDVLLTIWRRFSEEKIEHPYPLDMIPSE